MSPANLSQPVTLMPGCSVKPSGVAKATVFLHVTDKPSCPPIFWKKKRGFISQGFARGKYFNRVIIEDWQKETDL